MEEKRPVSLLQLIIGCLLISVVAYVLKINSLPPQIPLFYSRPEGEEVVADLLYVFIIPTMSLIFVAINQLLYRRYYRHNVFIGKVGYFTSAAILIVSTAIFLKIILLIS